MHDPFWIHTSTRRLMSRLQTPPGNSISVFSLELKIPLTQAKSHRLRISLNMLGNAQCEAAQLHHGKVMDSSSSVGASNASAMCMTPLGTTSSIHDTIRNQVSITSVMNIVLQASLDRYISLSQCHHYSRYPMKSTASLEPCRLLGLYDHKPLERR